MFSYMSTKNATFTIVVPGQGSLLLFGTPDVHLWYDPAAELTT
jgi:hypothetical protein